MTEADFKIVVDNATAPAGAVDIKIKNDGPTEHEFVVFKTDLAPDNLPLSEDGGEVDEESADLTAVDEVEDIAAGASANLRLTLEPGKYVFICNLPAHYGLGMHVGFEVSGS